MDLDDLLEDLVEDVADAARRRVRRVGREASRRTQVARRRVRRAARAGGLVVATVFGALTAALALAGSPGGLRLFAAALAAVVALTAGGVAVAAHRAERRDPRSRASRARRRRTRRRTGADAAGEVELAEASQVHPAVQDEWERLLQARRLVRDLTADGWIVAASGLEVDSDVLRLYQLLVADARTARLGGRPTPQLHRQVGELADLLVALADEAVRTRVQDAEGEMALPATLADAKDHLIALRTARREVEQIDRPHPRPGV